MEYFLQSRWRLEGKKLVYYGMRRGENLNKNDIKLNSRQAAVVKKLTIKLDKKQLKSVIKLVNNGIIVDEPPRKIPGSLNEAQFCKRCPANNFMIPGLEFDDDGLCPICAAEEQTKNLNSVVPIIDEIPRAKHSRFDIVVFYTGGKDSTYLLYYLSKVKKLRVLALTWLLPFASWSILNERRALLFGHGRKQEGRRRYG